ncbi:MAG TPA: peptidylprolyl isomerase [Verrucomicrobiae bacterium]|nr:peptidylprolyl isomerase [Verrucomicrobiae bacterium]
MIGTIRKHSKWLWWVVAGLMAISLVLWQSTAPSRGGGIAAGDYGKIYGHKITQQDYMNARNEFFVFYWLRNHEWPDRNSNLKSADIDQQIYLRLMLALKAQALDIHVTDEAAANTASDILQSLGGNGQSVSMQAFVTQVLKPEGLSAADFERFARSEVAIQQLIQTLALPGVLITPQEAAAAYQRAHQDVSAQVVFFSASNHLSQVPVTPAAVAEYYTNYVAQYRLPDRVQVSYVEFNLTNYLDQSKAEWARTNLDEDVNAVFQQMGMDKFPDAKTPEEAKADIRNQMIRQRALSDAQTVANTFATKVFDMTPVQAGNLAAIAKQEGFTVHLTAPFSSTYGPEEFAAPGSFTKAAFELTTNDPFAGPIVGTTAVYVMALDKDLPSEIPPLAQIRDRVAQDYRMMEATLIAQRAGTNFAATLPERLGAGHTFASICVAAGQQPVPLPPFSLSTQTLPALDDHADLSQFKQVVFATPTNHASAFVETPDGGFVVYVQSRTPVPAAAVAADLPQFTASMRRERENELFNQWIQTEANRQLRTTPVFTQQAAAAGAN